LKINSNSTKIFTFVSLSNSSLLIANVLSQLLAAEGVSHICSLFADGVASNANLRTSAAKKKNIKNWKPKVLFHYLLVY
jgi:hypothetical protein